ncbi:lysylphosphatidylglycerol synthase domain-containing protein [Streptomyces sp. ADMS]|uniref:lysylphosphatidylglycerol synthase domain-containing protein n=1 Tax=Streptomyces sp. ADMS TaxID=3071415 RepID=UPI00296FE851|nr:lysylphosphatidylglycerol synthase domain-containing protein [Streptomyces sp. ADMS]MDW4910799.1 lysylphosphatidylglycerol synthase domain-containing protein [Streptomyces sp. ADMS]
MTRKLWTSALRLIGYGGVVLFITWQLWRQRGDLVAGIAAVGWARCVVAEMLTVCGLWLGMLGWRMLLNTGGSRLPLGTAARLFFVSGLGKYVPGGLWPALAHAHLARTLRLQPARLAMTFLGSVALSLVAGLTVGLLAVPQLAVANSLWWVVLPLSIVALVPLFVPRVVRAGAGAVRRVTRRTGGSVELPSRRTVIGALGTMCLGWVVTGAHVLVLADGLAPDSLHLAPLVVGGFALSTVAGVAAVLMPAGLGVREVVLTLVLGAVLGGGAVITVVALSRILMTCADLLAAAAVNCVASLRGQRIATCLSPPPAGTRSGGTRWARVAVRAGSGSWWRSTGRR